MLLSRQREKLLNAIKYFSTHTDKCGKTKIFKLLFLLDFEHFKKIGRSVTGLDYRAYEMGPVPESLNAEFDYPEKDFNEHIKIELIPTSRGYLMYSPRPNKDFDHSHFSKRELKILERLSKKYYHQTADEMVEITHKKGSPWDLVYNVQKRFREHIPYEYVFNNQAVPEEINDSIEERNNISRNYI